MDEGEINRLLKLFVYQLSQDDPKNVPQIGFSHLRLVKTVYRISRIPKNSVVLIHTLRIPYFQEIEISYRKWLVVIDCSWERAEEVFSKRFHGLNRRLPSLLAANPLIMVTILSSVRLRLFAAALYIIGLKKEAEKIVGIFKWDMFL